MNAGFEPVFRTLKGVMEKHADRLAVLADDASVYNLAGRTPSPFPQHKGQPMWFGAVRMGKAYVSFHLMPLYMNARLQASVSPGLKRHMQGKTCFNFKKMPDPELLRELEHLTLAAVEDWAAKQWL